MYRGTWKGCISVAIKTATSAEGKMQLEKEAQFMRDVCHLNIVRFYGVSELKDGKVQPTSWHVRIRSHGCVVVIYAY